MLIKSGSDVPKEKRKKWSAKTTEMIFVGYDPQKKGFRCFDVESSKVIVRRDVKFFETLSSTVMMNGDEQPNDADRNDESIVASDLADMDAETHDPIAQTSGESLESDSDVDLDDTVVNEAHQMLKQQWLMLMKQRMTQMIRMTLISEHAHGRMCQQHHVKAAERKNR